MQAILPWFFYIFILKFDIVVWFSCNPATFGVYSCTPIHLWLTNELFTIEEIAIVYGVAISYPVLQKGSCDLLLFEFND